MTMKLKRYNQILCKFPKMKRLPLLGFLFYILLYKYIGDKNEYKRRKMVNW